jgi:hypothetical protein
VQRDVLYWPQQATGLIQCSKWLKSLQAPAASDRKDMGQMGALHHDRELELVVELCRPLAKIGLNVGMSDARPAAVIRTRNEPSLWITVDPSGEYFEWDEAQHRHPTTDPAGAAALVLDQVEARRSGLDGAP